MMSGWGDLPEIVRMLVALAFVVALMGGFAYVLKKLGLSGVVENVRTKGSNRLQIIESLTLDARRRLVILQRDDVQHLVILGANEETVIETGITAPENKDHE